MNRTPVSIAYEIVNGITIPDNRTAIVRWLLTVDDAIDTLVDSPTDLPLVNLCLSILTRHRDDVMKQWRAIKE